MNATKRTMYDRIEKHGHDLIRLFGLETEPVTLCKQLRRLEREVNAKMVAVCNGELTDDEATDYLINSLKPRLEKIFGPVGVMSIYINHDPRGYTLKLNEPTTARAEKRGINIYRDWGGYGILAPDLTLAGGEDV